MNYRQNILRNPISDLFGGGGGSQSSATTTNQQVGAEGNSGPVFGAISTKGGAIKQSATSTATLTKGQAKAAAKAAKKAGTSTATNAPSGAGPSTSGTPSIDNSASGTGPTTSDAGGGSGNVNISVVSGDSVAEQHNATLAAGSITAQNDLAEYSIAAQSGLATATLGIANQIAGLSFGLAAQSSAQSAQNSSDVAQAGQNLAAIGIGTQAAEQLISPTGGEAVQPTDYSKIALAVGVVGLLILILKD